MIGANPLFRSVKHYTHWLHTQWPAGRVEKLPEVNEDYSTNVPGFYIVGDLTGIPLLKFSSDSGARAVRNIVADPAFQKERTGAAEAGNNGNGRVLDLVIIGGGVSGMAAALEARKAGLSFEVVEAREPFSTVVNFPKAKPIYTYPTDMTPAGDLQFTATVKEPLVEELREQTLQKGIEPLIARVDRVERMGSRLESVISGGEGLLSLRVIIAIGRSGNFRKLGVPGEELDKVYNRLHDPLDFCSREVLVVGGGDSALETAIAIAQCGGRVTLSYREAEFTRPKPENIDKLMLLIADPTAEVSVETPVSSRVTTSTGGYIGEGDGGDRDKDREPGSVRLMLNNRVKEIREKEVTLIDGEGNEATIPNDVVFAMIGREAPLEFLRRSGINIAGEMGAKQWSALSLFVLFLAFVYVWKAGGSLTNLFERNGWFPFNIPEVISGLGSGLSSMAQDPSTLIGTMAITLTEPGFYYSIVYTALIIIFGIKRIRRRKTPYIKVQTTMLAAIQILPLFLLPYIILPYLGHNGLFDSGVGRVIADELFPAAAYGHGREYWRAFGFILAWPLFIWNVFSNEPLWGWLAISFLQTFVLIPLLVYYWGKGAYCGFICSCGAMAETMGDTLRHKMPHGARWNRVNMVGQAILAIAFLIFIARVISWIAPGSPIGRAFMGLYGGMLYGWSLFGIPLNYRYVVDLFLAGIIGYGLYFWFSGRVWCRFACPLAALMNIYARFSRFRILADKKKCISCNVCTSVCHQGIDVMNFANKGLPMNDPECVRCSACVQSCPTGVLRFGQVNPKTGEVIRVDTIHASPVLIRESGNATR